MTKKALIGFSTYSDTALIDRATTAAKSIDGNPDFVNPVPTPAAVQAASDAFYESFIAVRQGAGKQATAIKNERRAVLEELLKELGTYVNLIAKGNVAILDGSGFEVSKDPTAVGILPAPASFTLTTDGHPGEIDIHIEKVDRALGYLVQYRKDGDTEHTEVLFTKTRGLLTHLASVTRYYIRIGTVSKEASDAQRYNFTDEKSVVVQ